MNANAHLHSRRGLGALLALILLTAGAAHAGPAGNVSVTLISPLAGGIIHEIVPVSVDVVSDFEIATVVAEIDGQMANLAFDGSGWSGTIDVSGATWGAKSYTVTATDVFANQGMQAVQVTFDLPPMVTVITPVDFDAVGNTFQVQATCLDDAPTPCTRVEMRNAAWTTCAAGTIVGNNGPTLDKTANLPFSNHGAQVSTCIVGTDSSGQKTSHLVHLWVVNSPDMSEIDEASGRILDVTEDRMIFHGKVSGGGFGEPVGVRDRATGIETMVFDDLGIALDDQPVLTPLGMIAPVLVLESGWKPHVYDWRSDGTLHDIVTPCCFSVNFFESKGPWAMWVERIGSGMNDLIRRDLVAEINETVETEPTFGAALVSDGSVVYVDSTRTNMVRYDGVSVVPIFSSTPPDLLGSPQTDGGAIAYLKTRPVMPSGVEYAVAYYKDGVETQLDPFDPDNPTQFLLAGDWLAFSRLGTANQRQVWNRSPGGVETQITFFSSNSFVESMNRRGDVVFSNGGTRYLATPYATVPLNLGVGSNESFWIGDRLYMAYGRKLFEVAIEFFSGGFEGGDTTAWSVAVP